MKLLANENFPLKSFGALKEKGYDIKHIGFGRRCERPERKYEHLRPANCLLFTGNPVRSYELGWQGRAGAVSWVFQNFGRKLTVVVS